MPEEPQTLPPRPIPAWTPSTLAVRVSSFEAFIKINEAVVVHFWAAWNGHDRAFDRSIQAAAHSFRDRVHFASCDVDLKQNAELCNRCGVANIPFLAVFINGKERRPIIGHRSPQELTDDLEARLSANHPRKKWYEFWKGAG